MKPLKIGFIGSGFIAHFLAKAMVQVRHCELTAIYRRSGADTLAAYAKSEGLGEPVLCDRIKDLVEKVDAVAIFSPNFTRLSVMEEVVDAVKKGASLTGVICEKPLGRTIREATRMVELAREAKLKTSYFENQLHMSVITHALDQLQPQQEAMGPITLARSTEEHAGPHSSWFWDPEKQGGGVLSDMGCHSIAACKYILTPVGKPLDYLKPVSVQAETSLLKWGQPVFRKQLKERYGVDYEKRPSEDFASGIFTFEHPDSGMRVKGQFTDSWMYDKQGLRLSMDGLGPGYAMEVNTLISPLEIFIGDEAAEGAADAETALEKSTATRGLMAVHPNEADLYGYVTELKDAVDAFREGRDAKLSFEFGLEVTRLVQAAYMAAEKGITLDLTDSATQTELESYQSAISKGEGADLLLS
ncbi:MAG: Gfo/Idh/MocA family oxidoreductase [Balneolaceae bacterium]